MLKALTLLQQLHRYTQPSTSCDNGLHTRFIQGKCAVTLSWDLTVCKTGALHVQHTACCDVSDVTLPPKSSSLYEYPPSLHPSSAVIGPTVVVQL